MGVGVSIFLIAVGAILDFAVKVNGDSHGFNINKIGLILLIVGIIGLIVSMIFWSSWGGIGSSRRNRVVQGGTAPGGYSDGRGRRVVEEPAPRYVEDERL